MIKELQGNLLHQIRWNKKFLWSSPCRSTIQQQATGKPIANYERRCEKNYLEVGQFFFVLLSPNAVKNRSLCREYTLPWDVMENCAKGWIESDARFGPVSETHGRYSVEVNVASLFEDKTASWIRIVTGVENYVREAMPIQEEERSSVKPAAKSKPILKPSSTSNRIFIPMGQRNGATLKCKGPRTVIASRCQNSLVNYFDTRKLVEKKMPEFLMIELFRNAREFYQRIQDIGQTNWNKN